MNIRNNRKNSRAGTMVTLVIFVLVAAFLIIDGIIQCINVNSSNILDIASASPSDFKNGTYVEGEIFLSYGCYAEEEETTNYVFKRTSGYYYLIPVCYYDKNTGDFTEDVRYVGIKVGKGDNSFFEDLTDYTYGVTFTDPGTYKFKGKIRSTGSDEEEYKMSFIKSGFTDDEMQDPDIVSKNYYELPYTIQIIKPVDYLSMILIGAVIIIVCAIIIVINVIKSKNAASASPAAASTPAGSIPPEFMTQQTYQPSSQDPFASQTGSQGSFAGQETTSQGQPFVPWNGTGNTSSGTEASTSGIDSNTFNLK